MVLVVLMNFASGISEKKCPKRNSLIHSDSLVSESDGLFY
jgi:hypothetical protein